MEILQKKDYDVTIIGGGPGGLSAGLWSAELGLRGVLLESGNELGGQLLWTYNAIRNHLGVEADNGRALQKRFLEQIENRRFEIRTNSPVTEIDVRNKRVRLSSGGYLSSHAVVIATGVRRRKLNIDGEEKFKSSGIIESGQRDAGMVRDKTVCIVGGGDAALENALILAETAARVILVHRGTTFRARAEFVAKAEQNRKIQIFRETTVSQIIGEDRPEAVTLNRRKETFVVETDFVLFRLGVQPNSELLNGQIALDHQGYCRIDSNCETNVQNVYAIGDIASPLAPTISGAVGMGATAVKCLYHRITR